jgi:hypothetical protein
MGDMLYVNEKNLVRISYHILLLLHKEGQLNA